MLRTRPAHHDPFQIIIELVEIRIAARRIRFFDQSPGHLFGLAVNLNEDLLPFLQLHSFMNHVLCQLAHSWIFHNVLLFQHFKNL